MCTVTYVNCNGKFIITSNRDEKIVRPKSIAPKTYLINSKKVFFPKDPKAGGTWYAVDDTGNVLVLLNGASEKHIQEQEYSKSRGLIVLEIIGSENCLLHWQSISLENIEPFTLVFFSNKELYQLRWNGFLKETTKLDSNKNYIWSSSTLYPKNVRVSREQWFYNFLLNKDTISTDEMLHFHQYTEKDDKENGLVINRDDTLITQSITQTLINNNRLTFAHIDLIENVQHENTFLLL
jgi:uncharacterized protein with NRDE domain